MRLRTPLLAFLIIALATGFLLFVVPDCVKMHPTACLASGGAPLAPFAYRVLFPAIEGILAPNAKPITLLWVDMLLQAAIVALSIPLLYSWFRRWTNEDRSMIGVMVFGVVWLMALHYYYRSIGTSLEVLSVVVALALLRGKSRLNTL